MLAQLKKNLSVAANRMKQVADKHRWDIEFQKDDLGFLKLQPYRRTSVFKMAHKKLATIYFWPYRVIDRIGYVAYKQQLPEGEQIHLVFHVSLLKKVVGDLQVSSNELPNITEC